MISQRFPAVQASWCRMGYNSRDYSFIKDNYHDF